MDTPSVGEVWIFSGTSHYIYCRQVHPWAHKTHSAIAGVQIRALIDIRALFPTLNDILYAYTLCCSKYYVWVYQLL